MKSHSPVPSKDARNCNIKSDSTIFFKNSYESTEQTDHIANHFESYFYGIFLGRYIVYEVYRLVIFTIASLTDLYDGYLARKTGVITSFGKFMDPLADKILTSTALICFASLGYIYIWMVLVIIGRDFIVTGLRCIAAYRGLLILPTQVAKWKTASQMVVIVIILLYINVKTTMIAFSEWNGDYDDFAWYLFNGMVFVSMTLTVSSGFDYIIKNRSIFTSLLR